MGRMDISSAFRLLIINPGDFEFFGFKFKDNYYFDNYLPMGCSASCQLFEKKCHIFRMVSQKQVEKTHYLSII
jgi:hypothetical protein